MNTILDFFRKIGDLFRREDGPLIYNGDFEKGLDGWTTSRSFMEVTTGDKVGWDSNKTKVLKSPSYWGTFLTTSKTFEIQKGKRYNLAMELYVYEQRTAGEHSYNSRLSIDVGQQDIWDPGVLNSKETPFHFVVDKTFVADRSNKEAKLSITAQECGYCVDNIILSKL